MKSPLKQRVFLTGVVIALAGVLIALAVLQYRWAREVSDATNVRLQANLDSSILGWREDLYRELTGVFAALQVDPGQSPHQKAAQYAQQYQSWSQTAAHPDLISHLFLFQNAGTEHSQLLQWNAATNQFEPADWPAELDRLHNWMQIRSEEMVKAAGAVMRLRQQDRLRRHSNGSTSPFGGHRLFGPDGFPATVDVNAMTLVRLQIRHTSHSAGNQSKGQSAPAIDWAVVRLDSKVFQEHVLPELVERHFSGSQGLDYQVAVVAGPSSVVYSSDAGFGKQDGAAFDRTIPVYGPPHGPPARRGMAPPSFAPSAHLHGGGTRDNGFAGPLRLDAIHYTDADTDWQLLVRHRLGSLEAVVSGMRRRNLALSFGVLLVLAGGIAIILISSQRARVLAKLQMDFVAAVSHELRTPLAVISSAAENIIDGVVAGKQQLSQYGIEIKNQARHLIKLVEQILLFSATRNKGHHYSLRPLRVSDVIETALKDTAGLIEENRFTVEREVAPNLPPIMGDLPALSHCLQNLITNAVKYGGDARWMRISAKANDASGQYDEVQVSVEDKGLGISAGELRRIFEPFYRSRSVDAGQIHGTGLGLSLARDIAAAMGGRLTVTSEPGKGSCFTLYLRFAEVAELQTAPQAAAAVNPNLSKT
ncbi:MAG TPA: HAMP domain-containing sensor histidine kinase [Candidatus Angelobacter sp.]